MASKSGQQEPEKAEVIEELLDALDTTLDRVKVLYEQYFLGIQKQPPTYLHTDIERKIRDLAQIQIRNTALRYRFATLQQKFGSYHSYWRRTLRQIENGTYTRSLFKIGRQAVKTGAAVPEEILAAMPKRMRDQVLRDREAALALARRRERQAEPADESLTPAEEDFEIDVTDLGSDDLDAAAFIRESSDVRRNALTASGAYRIDESDADFDLEAFFDSVVRDPDPPALEAVLAAAPVVDPPRRAAARAEGEIGPPAVSRTRAGHPRSASVSGSADAAVPSHPRLPSAGLPTGESASRAARAASQADAEPASQATGSRRVVRAASHTDTEPMSLPVLQPEVAPAPVAPAASPAAGGRSPEPAPVATRGAPNMPRAVLQPESAPAPAAPVGSPVAEAGSPEPAPVSPRGGPNVPRIPAPPPRGAPVPAAPASAPPGEAGAPDPAPGPSRGAPRFPRIPAPPPGKSTPRAPLPSVLRPVPPDAAKPPAVPDAAKPRARPDATKPPAGPDTAKPPAPPPSQATRPLRVAPGAAAAHASATVETLVGPFPRVPGTPGGSRAPSAPEAPSPGPPAERAEPAEAPSASALRESPTSPGARSSPASRRTPPPERTPPEPRPSPPPGMSDDDVNALYAKYVKAKQILGEETEPGTYGKLLQTIHAQAPKIMEQYKSKGVDFSVVVKDNQVVIRAKPKP